MRLKKWMAMVLAAISVTTGALAQTTTAATGLSGSSYKNMNISSIPESTIKEYAQKAEDSGMSLDDVITLAASKGATEQQQQQLKMRLSRYLKNKTTSSSSSSSSLSSIGSEVTLSTREVADKAADPRDSLVFGYYLFNRSGLTFEPTTNLAIGDAYVIGAGDDIDVDIYGSSDQTYSLTVSTDGTVVIPMVGPVKVGGMTVENARRSVAAKLRRIHSDIGSQSGINLRVTSAKPVTVSVMGEAHTPGTFTVSSASTLFNVLYLSGGPNFNGSYRDVQLIRGGKVIAHLDIYDFLLNGKNDVNPSLANGDIVMIPTYLKRIEMKGEFKRNALFEAKEGETVADLIRYAGGFTAEAQTDHIGLYRIGKYTTEYKDVTDPGSVQVCNGDKLECGKKKVERIDNSVTIEGSVFAPGVFEFTEGLTLKDLIEKAGGLTENAFLNRGVVTRYKDDYTLEALSFNVLDASNGTANVTLKANDVITIASIDDMREKPEVFIFGNVPKEGSYDFRENMTLGDLIVLAGGMLEYTVLPSVEIVRRVPPANLENSTDETRTISTVSITADLSLQGQGNNFKLEPFDVVYLRKYATAAKDMTVYVDGAVNNPGLYSLHKSVTRISELMARCGGFTSDADRDGARLYRRLDMSDAEREIRLRLSALKGDTSTYYLKTGADLYEPVALDLNEALANPGSEDDIILRDGDRIEIHTNSQTVRVSGLVQNPMNVNWEKRWRANDYIDAVGGFAANAHKRKTYVVYANGESARVRHFLFVRIYPKVKPGAEVIVPVKPQSSLTVPAIVSMSSSIVSMIAVIVALTK